MGILTIQKRARELGRIRLGIQEPIAGRPGKFRPAKLETFRLTSATREYVEAAAEVYHGEVRPWKSPRGPEWEVVIESPHLEVIIPPDEVVDPWFELWTGGGCQRRCDGVTEQLSGQPCMCPADPKARQELAGKGEACKATTRLNVALPALPDLGVWRLETHSYYAAVEITGTAELLRQATAAGVMVRARLRIDRRQVTRPGAPRRDFIVPVLEIPDLRLDSLLASGPIVSRARQLDAPGSGGRPALPPGPSLDERPVLRPAAPQAQGHPAAGRDAADADTREPDPGAPGASTGPSLSDEEANAVWREVDAEQAAPAAAMTSEAFTAWLEEHRISLDYARGIAASLFPGVRRLDAEQRAQLADHLAKES